MSNDVTLPALGESVTEGTVTRWLKSVGDDVAVDEPLLEISTDKVDTEIPSPFAGKLTEILVQEDDTVEVGAVLARIGESSGSAEPAAEPAAEAETTEAAEATDAQAGPEPATQARVEAETTMAAKQEAAPEAEPETESAPTPEPAPDPEPETQPAPAPEPEAAAEAPAAAPASAEGGGDTREVKLPALGESVTEGTITRWLKAVGDAVEADEPLVEVSTDKVDTEIPSPFAGTLLEIVANEDETVAVDAVLARIGSAGAAPAAASTPEPEAAPAVEAKPEPEPEPEPEPAVEVAAEPKQKESPAPQETPAAPQTAPAAPSSAPSGSTTGSGYVTPIVRKLASERGVDLSAVSGTGVGGRIRKEDVLSAKPAGAAEEKAPAASAATAAAPAPSTGAESELRGTTVKMSRIRKVVAKVMVDSLHTQAQLTTVIEVDVSRVWTLRAKAKEAFKEREKANLTFLPFFTLAVAEALREHAFLNASIDGENIVYHPKVNLGIAVDTEKGLMVPVIKNAEDKSLADHAREIADLADRARNGGLTPDEMAGATFSVTNTGSGGTIMDTPIVANPQVGILATCAIVKKPVVVKGPDGGDVLAIRPMCYLPLSYDHRLVDGADAARFLQTVKARIEEGAFESQLGL